MAFASLRNERIDGDVAGYVVRCCVIFISHRTTLVLVTVQCVTFLFKCTADMKRATYNSVRATNFVYYLLMHPPQT